MDIIWSVSVDAECHTDGCTSVYLTLQNLETVRVAERKYPLMTTAYTVFKDVSHVVSQWACGDFDVTNDDEMLQLVWEQLEFGWDQPAPKGHQK